MPAIRTILPPLLGAILLASAAWADCEAPYETLFACDIPERNAQVEFCQLISSDNPDALPSSQYTYWADGQVELQFQTNKTWFGLKNSITGMRGRPIGNGFANGKTVYAFFFDGDAYVETHSVPREAQIHVYNNSDDFNSEAEPIARRHCYPPTIYVSPEGIGP